MSFERHHKTLLAKRLEEEPRRFIQVLYGPRQVGKTTVVSQFAAQTRLPVHFVSADAVYGDAQTWLAQQWSTARLLLRRLGAPEAVLIVDEIQKVPNWSESVKREWDADTRDGVPLKVVLLGSSRLMLQQGLTESLAGRFETQYVGHWTYAEMHAAFGVETDAFVWFGAYPGAAALMMDELRWRQYVLDALIEPSISKDILMLTRVDKPALMRRLFELGCRYSGQIMSYNKMLGQLLDAGNTTTLAHYLRLLDTAGLLAGLEQYSPQVLRQRASSPKFQVHNTALLSAQQPQSFQEVRSTLHLWGHWVESAVGAHLLNYAISKGAQLWYWRNGDMEVDFVLAHQGKVVAIEVKSGSGRTGSGMSAFVATHQPDRVYLIGEEGLPWETFLEMDPGELLR
ncbi:MAG: ATP-binding protein [Saprospiraceae bacterium]